MTDTDKISLSMEELTAMIQKAVAASVPAKKAKAGKGKPGPKLLTEAEKAERRAKADADCIKAFTKEGYKDVKPRVNVLVYGKLRDDGTLSGWLGQGRRVKKGEKAIKVGSFPLFHISQTEEMVKREGTVH